MSGVTVSLAPARTLPDLQADGDSRGVHLDAVGVTGIALPATVLGPGGSRQATVAELELSVSLGANTRAIHMSRLVEHAAGMADITPSTLMELAESLCVRLGATDSRALLRFPLFIERAAPVSGVTAPHRYDAWLSAVADSMGRDEGVVSIGVRTPITSLCPCSREISDYGAHSQRGHVELEVEAAGWLDGTSIWPQELFNYADGAGSAQIYPLLKRPDERAVTMLAYDQPAFVEDIAREVVLAVESDERCTAWSVQVVNQESIHDHQAVARVRGRR
jgi:GTP cyclohydrolase IB